MKHVGSLLLLLFVSACTRGATGDGGGRDGGVHHRPLCMDTPDSDRDGVADELEGGVGVDSDADGLPNIGDLDDDGDTLLTSLEAGPNPCAPIDTDFDGTPDFLDLDSDNDGIPDSEE